MTFYSFTVPLGYIKYINLQSRNLVSGDTLVRNYYSKAYRSQKLIATEVWLHGAFRKGLEE